MILYPFVVMMFDINNLLCISYKLIELDIVHHSLKGIVSRDGVSTEAFGI
jgi:hypothetical protein